MIRNLKVFGSALVAILALSAGATSFASAQGKLTSDGAVTQIATPTGAPSANAITAFGGEIRCLEPTYTGHKTSVTPHELIPSGSTTATITPHLGVCSALGFPATVDMNGCDLVFTFGGTLAADQYAVSVSVVCPMNQHVRVTIFSSAAKHTANESFCTMTITENAEPYAGLSTTDTTNGTLDTTGTVAGLTMDRDSPTGSILCPSGSTSAASLAVDLTVVGRNAGGGATSMSISE